MTYNQVQSFQINDYANHYEGIENTGYRAIYSKSIAGRGIARLISWLGTAGPVDCFNKSVSDCYIRVYRSFQLNTVGRIIFEDKKFRGFRGCSVNLENKYPCNFLYIRLDSSFNTWWGIRTRSIPRHMSNDSIII